MRIRPKADSRWNWQAFELKDANISNLRFVDDLEKGRQFDQLRQHLILG